jgi:hypothetical protein
MNLPIPTSSPIQPYQIDDDILVTAAFPKSVSKNFSAALNLAQNANRFCVIDIEGKPYHLAAFGNTQQQTDVCGFLIDIISQWKGVHFYVKKRHVSNYYAIKSVLECYQNSMRCASPQSYCHTIKEDFSINEIVSNDEIKDVSNKKSIGFSLSIADVFSSLNPKKTNQNDNQWLHPCRKIVDYYNDRIDLRLPFTPQEQMQVLAVKHDCEWCPNFNAKSLKRL